MLYHELSVKILDAVFEVHRALGSGLLEKCYHNALYYELQAAGLSVGYNVPFTVTYKGNVVGEYLADLVVDGKVVLELKSVKALGNEYINPFFESLSTVLHDMLGANPRRGEMYVKSTSTPILGVAAIIGLFGDLEGRVLYDMSEKTALAISSEMNMANMNSPL